ncbi:DNA-binding protein DDB [Sesamum angolense]|uniref:DNA-binding protein DDB n=1 Tax=Sesamum angolense TaxID=2727404 RepID=A0AAE1WU42_9LAMI|nr:DNA-binding protein DDB [Sesamum angolense]
MADPELEAIRERRMQELMGQRGVGNNQKSEQQKAQEEAKRRRNKANDPCSDFDIRSTGETCQVWRKNCRVRISNGENGYISIVAYLWRFIKGFSCRFGFHFVRAVARIALVKPEKARGVEDVIIRAAQMGQIVDQVSEERLISLLEQINTQTTKETKVTIKRRQSVLDDD